MKKIYEQTNDLHVRNILFYGNTEDHKLYVDKALTKQATQAQVEDAFVKGQLLIKAGEGMFIPVSITANTVTTVSGSENVTFSAEVPEAE